MPALNSCIFITCRYISDLKVLIYYFCCQHLRVCTTVIRRRGVAHGFIKFLISAVSAIFVIALMDSINIVHLDEQTFFRKEIGAMLKRERKLTHQ